MNRKIAAMTGALVADAAALGLHWLYDVNRISKVIGDGSPAFVPIDQKNFEGTQGYFAHSARKDGQNSQYGETLKVAMQSSVEHGRFIQTKYQDAYYAHFGPGGGYVGYIDRPTKGALENIHNGQRMPSGIDDDQHPAVSTVPAVVAVHGNDLDIINLGIKVTNVNADATRYGHLFATTLNHLFEDTEDLEKAMVDAAQSSSKLRKAINTRGDNPVDFGDVVGRACHLKQGMPLSWHILKNTSSYKEAVEMNIRAGGDSCGRAIIIGSLAGAAYGYKTIPPEWIEKVEGYEELLSLAQKLAA